MANIYNVGIKEAGGGHRYLHIVTDTIQNALSIAKTKCKWNEEVDEVFTSCEDPIIDHSVVKSGE